MDYKVMLDQIISDIENGNYTMEFKNGGYSYSNEITNLFEILRADEFKKIFDENIEEYTFDDKKRLDQQTDPETYNLIDCVIVLNWIWHVENGIAVGTIAKKINNGTYLKTLKQFRKLMK